jgi:uncharacterized protein YjiS (DUF1127 family)
MSCKTIEISLPVQPIEAEPNWPFLRWLDWLLTLPSVVHYLHKRQRGRRELLELDEHLLDDIGLTREKAEEIASRPFWR